jgi:hypothetical protein
VYNWPIKPFRRQHPIRGTFDDPRISTKLIDSPGTGSLSFHFGVDIAAPDGTAVYAVEGGLVDIRSKYPNDVAVVSRSGGHKGRLVFGYWHIRPVVENRQVVQEHQLLGHILAGYGHVHFAERLGGKYVNPLRRGGLTPYRDYGKPTIESAYTYQGGEYQDLKQATVGGTVGLVVNAFDTPVMKTPWSLERLTPTVIRWKLVDAQGMVLQDHVAIDFNHHYTVPLTSVYAPGTIQNGPNQMGVYNFWLARNLDTIQLTNGVYRLMVSASDIRGNRSVRTFGFKISN